MLKNNLKYTKSKNVFDALLFVFGEKKSKLFRSYQLEKYRASTFDLLIAEADKFQEEEEQRRQQQQQQQQKKHLKQSSVEYLRNMDKTPQIHSRISAPTNHRPINEQDYDQNMLKRYHQQFFISYIISLRYP